jgi:hypothetical protein
MVWQVSGADAPARSRLLSLGDGCERSAQGHRLDGPPEHGVGLHEFMRASQADFVPLFRLTGSGCGVGLQHIVGFMNQGDMMARMALTGLRCLSLLCSVVRPNQPSQRGSLLRGGLLPVGAVFDGHDPYRAGNDPAFAPSEAASSRFRIQDATVPASSDHRSVGTSAQRGRNPSATLALWPAGSDAGVMAGELISGGHRAPCHLA